MRPTRPAPPLDRAAYLAASAGLFFSQHVATLVVLSLLPAHAAPPPWWFWLNPFRTLLGPALSQGDRGAAILSLAMAATVAVDAGLARLALRRIGRLRRHAWVAALTLVPVLQLGAITWLALAPETAPGEEATEVARARPGVRAAILGVLLGVGAVVGAVALSTLVFGLYGYTLFLVSPLLIAVAVGYVTRRQGPAPFSQRLALVWLTFLLGGAALVGFAMEGLFCLVLASPLVAAMGVIGLLIGSALADVGRPGQGAALGSVALLPMLIAAEALLPPHTRFDSVDAIDIAAPPAAVWSALVHMEPLDEAAPAPFRWGLAYPLSARIDGEGVGAIRRSRFSTGQAVERVSVWRPGAELAFVVLSEPPAMREFSPYAAVHAPHVSGYFRTREVDFVLAPLPGGRTRLTLTSGHDLDLEPVLYWAPLARWAVHANTDRVLAHFRRQAESAAPGGHRLLAAGAPTFLHEARNGHAKL